MCFPGGTVVGRTNEEAEHPSERPRQPHDLLPTIDHVLGINPHTTFPDFASRPVAISDGEVIPENLG